MRDTWTDLKGRVWPVVASVGRLKFKYPSHAALREHVFIRDGFKCCQCGACAVDVPKDWNGSTTLFTNTTLRSGWADLLVVDHILTLKAGGKNIVSNMQTLCETCNRRKQKVDKAATRAYLLEVA